MSHSEPESWREIAEAILHESDREAASILGNELCQAFDLKPTEQHVEQDMHEEIERGWRTNTLVLNQRDSSTR